MASRRVSKGTPTRSGTPGTDRGKGESNTNGVCVPPPPMLNEAECRPYPNRKETVTDRKAPQIRAPAASERRGVGKAARIEGEQPPMVSPGPSTPMRSWEGRLMTLPKPDVTAAAGELAGILGGLTAADRKALVDTAVEVGAKGDEALMEVAAGRNWASAAWEHERLRSPGAPPSAHRHVVRLHQLEGEQPSVTARVVNAVTTALHRIEKQDLNVLKEGLRPSCMQQFNELIGRCRVPSSDWDGKSEDKEAVVGEDEQSHACLLRKGCMFSFPVLDARSAPLPVATLRRALEEVDKRCDAALSTPHHEEAGGGLLTSLTSLPRAEWAAARRTLAGGKVIVTLTSEALEEGGITLKQNDIYEQLDSGVWTQVPPPSATPGPGDDPETPPVIKLKRGQRVVRSVVVVGVQDAARQCGLQVGMQVLEVGGCVVRTSTEAADLLAAAGKGEDGGGCSITALTPGDPRGERAIACAERALFIVAVEDEVTEDGGAEARALGFGGELHRWWPHALQVVVAPGKGAVNPRRLSRLGGLGLSVDDEGNVTQVEGNAASAGVPVGSKLVSINGSPFTGPGDLKACEGEESNLHAVLGFEAGTAVALVAEGTCVDSVPLQWLGATVHRIASSTEDGADEGVSEADPPPTGVKPLGGALSAELQALVTPFPALKTHCGSSVLWVRADATGEPGPGMRYLHRVNVDPEGLVQVVGALAFARLRGELGVGHHFQFLNRFRGGRQLGRVPSCTGDVLRFVHAWTGHDKERTHPKLDLSLLLRKACATQESLTKDCEDRGGALTNLCALAGVAPESPLVALPCFQKHVQTADYTASRVAARHIPDAATGMEVAAVGGLPATPSVLHFTYCVDDPSGMRFCFVWTHPDMARFPEVFEDSLNTCVGLLQFQKAISRQTVGDLRTRVVHKSR
eukprot:Hpha_TRINITY_DN13837_c0_g1::TRINITY_DN13837_c0_g1_i1::g.69974::m.69974